MQVYEIFPAIVERNTQVIKMQTQGLSNEDSLLQPSFRGNCLNWVLGHLIYHRSRILDTLSYSPDWSGTLLQRYQRESEPITGPGTDVLPLSHLQSLLEQSQKYILIALPQISPASWQETVKEKTLEERINFFLWHETYHIGQLELLRQLTGKNDKVI